MQQEFAKTRRLFDLTIPSIVHCFVGHRSSGHKWGAKEAVNITGIQWEFSLPCSSCGSKTQSGTFEPWWSFLEEIYLKSFSTVKEAIRKLTCYAWKAFLNLTAIYFKSAEPPFCKGEILPLFFSGWAHAHMMSCVEFEHAQWARIQGSPKRLPYIAKIWAAGLSSSCPVLAVLVDFVLHTWTIEQDVWGDEQRRD